MSHNRGPGHSGQSTGPPPPDPAELRRRAEQKIAALEPQETGTLWPAEARRVLQELRVHQIELEMQNEELRVAREQLEASRARYFNLYDLAPVGYVTLSDAGQILEANLTAATQLGVDRRALSGQPLTSFILRDDEDIYYFLRRGLSQTNGPQTCELRMKKKGDESFWARLEVSVGPDEGGGLICRVVVHDITERSKAEELRSHLAAVTESEERFRNTADIAPVMIWVCGPDKGFTFFNKTWLDFKGRTLEQELGSGWVQGVHPDDLDHCIASFSSAFDVQQKFQIESRLRRADGEYRWVLCTGVPRYEPSAVFAGYIGSVIDVTDQKITEAALCRDLDQIARVNRISALGELAASIAHELNQPLAAILSNAQAAKRFLSSDPVDLAQAGECLNDIVADDRRAGEVIWRMRGLLRKEAPQEDLVDLNEIVSDVLRLLRNDALLRQVSVTFEGLAALKPVRGDRTQLYQMVLNLVLNAYDAVAEQPSGSRNVLVRTAESEEGRVQLTVQDSGKGIPVANLGHVFDPFFTTKPHGLGMGLSICRTIVRAHGGRLSAENNSEGAIFRCVLPAAQQTLASAL